MQFRATLGGSTIIFLKNYDFLEKTMYVTMQSEAIWGNLRQFGVISSNFVRYGKLNEKIFEFSKHFHGGIWGNLRQFRAISSNFG